MAGELGRCRSVQDPGLQRKSLGRREWPAEPSEYKEDRELPNGFGQVEVTAVTLEQAIFVRKKAANAGSRLNKIKTYKAILKFIL